jgi:hypothetical protein
MGTQAYGVPPGRPAAYPPPFGPAPTKAQEIEALKGQSEYLEGALEDIRKRIEQLQAESPEQPG